MNTPKTHIEIVRKYELLYRFYNAYTPRPNEKQKIKRKQRNWAKKETSPERNCIFELLVLVIHRNKCIYVYISAYNIRTVQWCKAPKHYDAE